MTNACEAGGRTIINRAVSNGQAKFKLAVFRIRSSLTMAAPSVRSGWGKRSPGCKELFEFWKQYLQPKGYKN